ncbi:reverse transcriptase [Phytophthora megakarya]|uniref:Reverse transcriptase n=1 Tax=Phytophthora megakarya TaxID=4795 RepID=A0A225WW86_9STRA|nr:reverse transcriptase [Phytophthora megakarya]
MWYEAGDCPNSFLHANTSLLLTKVAPTLEQRIHPHQNGFVLERHIHDTLDLFAAAQAMAKSFPESNHAIAVLLDFAKAYDSIPRIVVCGTHATRISVTFCSRN